MPDPEKVISLKQVAKMDSKEKALLFSMLASIGRKVETMRHDTYHDDHDFCFLMDCDKCEALAKSYEKLDEDEHH
jgi:hypothetical protein